MEGILLPYCDAFHKDIFCKTGYWCSIKYRKELGLVIEDVAVVSLLGFSRVINQWKVLLVSGEHQHHNQWKVLLVWTVLLVYFAKCLWTQPSMHRCSLSSDLQVSESVNPPFSLINYIILCPFLASHPKERFCADSVWAPRPLSPGPR